MNTDGHEFGWRLFPSLLLLKGTHAGLSSRSPDDAVEPSRLVGLHRPSCHFADHSFLVCVRQARLPLGYSGYVEAVFRNACSPSLLIPEIPSRSTPRPSFQASKPMTMDPMSTRLRMVGVGTPNWLPTEAQAARP